MDPSSPLVRGKVPSRCNTYAQTALKILNEEIVRPFHIDLGQHGKIIERGMDPYQSSS